MRNVPSVAELEPLRQLSESLARAYGWQPAQAVIFVLTDVIPVVPVTRVTVRRPSGRHRRVEVIPTEVHPHQEPEAVAEILRRVREREGLRQKRPEAHQVALADFMAGKVIAGVAAMDEWNRACRRGDFPSEWAYSDRRTLSKAVERARDAVA